MRILVVGAGALGGYFGGRLLQAGRDVTFLVREQRAEQLRREGLHISSPHGAFAVPAPTILRQDCVQPFDLILLAVKAYSLDQAIEDLAFAVGPATAILPVINGLAHLEKLASRFGVDRVLGGAAQISATLAPNGHVTHLLPSQSLIFGEMTGSDSERMGLFSAALGNAGFEARAVGTIIHDMWEKWVSLATLAGITCLMRGSIADIIASGGQDAILQLFQECCNIAKAAGFPLRPPFTALCMSMFTAAGSPRKASMLRDIEASSVTEGKHVLDDMVIRARSYKLEAPVLSLAAIHVATYEVSRLAATAPKSAP